jgi:hypothetical protein
MTLSAEHAPLLRLLTPTWPTDWQLTAAGDALVIPIRHPLAHELVAFCRGEVASLPYFSGQTDIVWFTLAPDADELRSAIDDLRAWLIPSFGWEDPRGWVVSPEQATGGIGSLLLRWAPAGYCRWRCNRGEQLNRVLEKLRLRRRLVASRPQHVVSRVPSLIELRQRFVSALAVGDREAAQVCVDLIDRHQLDSADNTLFMNYRCWARFGEWDEITSSSDLERFVQIRSPRLVQTDVIRAFHERYLATAEEAHDWPRVLAAYREHAHEPLTGLLARTQVDSEPVVQRVLAYRARHLDDRAAAGRLLSVCSDEIARRVLQDLPSHEELPHADILEHWLTARRSGDWQRVQELGTILLGEFPEIIPVLRRSLEVLPNDELAALLATTTGPRIQTITVSWLGCIRAVRANNFDEAQRFLDDRPRDQAANLSALETVRLQTELDELLCEGRLDRDLTFRQTATGAVTELVSDLVSLPLFPRSDLGPLYRSLLRLWSSLKQGSASPSDAQILLELADAVLQLDVTAEQEVGDMIQAWWKAHPTRAMLPFLLDAVELLDRLAVRRSCENLWIEGATFLRANLDSLTSGERELWRHAGDRIGFDAATLNEYCPTVPTSEAADPLRVAGLGRIAIVSLRERPAREAAEAIRERTGARVDIISGTVAGTGTDQAITADVVLFVWAATTHAVLRAFDGLDRRRLAYVSGTGSASIVRTLERWLRENEERLHA